MATYSVSLGYVLNGQIEVEAEDEDDAREKACEEFKADYPEMRESGAELIVDFAYLVSI